MGGKSPEREISLKTGGAILRVLLEKQYNAVGIVVTKEIATRLIEESIEVAFIALHGPLGEDGTVQGLLEILEIPYTGSGPLASAIAMNKIVTKKILSYHNLPTPAFVSFERQRKDINLPFSYPVVVKPAEGGSTIGVSIVKDKQQLKEAVEKASLYSKKILIEKFINGKEITLGILNGRPLPLIEIVPRKGFYDFHSKYTKGETEYILPAVLDEDISKEITTLGLAAYDAIGCEGAVRIDFMLDQDQKPHILEVNTVPGMTETSLLPMAARYVGIEFSKLVEGILQGASLKK